VYYQFLNRSASPVGPVFTLFQSQGTNSPLFGGVLFDGNRFAVVADIGFLEVGSDGGIHGFGSGAVYGAFVPKSSAPPQLIVTTPIFSLLLTGTPGINYAIQASTNLAFTNWTALATNSPTNGSFKFIDSHATNANRFYRALKQ
jgi:hypothetical protein